VTGTILTLAIASERDTVAARQRARQIARLLDFDPQDQIRISTAVSEIVRNAFNYAGGGRVEYSIEGCTPPQLFTIKIKDSGPGVGDLDDILEGRYKSSTGMGMGILGARRLMDQFQVESVLGNGTTIWLKKLLPSRSRVWSGQELAVIADSLLREGPQDAFQELKHQNQELLSALEEIRTRQFELTRLNRELEDTNRGVVALYAELNQKADLLRDAHQKLGTHAEELRRSNEDFSQFAHVASHDLRSPLNTITQFTQLLEQKYGDVAGGKELVAYIADAAARMRRLIDDLLSYATASADTVKALAPIDANVQLRMAIENLRSLVNESGAVITHDSLPAVAISETSLGQIFQNLIGNAITYRSAELPRIHISAVEQGEMWQFSCRDNGIGIAPEFQTQVFAAFRRLHGADRPGSGIGLAVCKKLVERHGGAIWVESIFGQGSKFCFTLRRRV
jgi:signal transduction histidine kinase